MRLVINNIDFDERLDDLKSFIHYNVDQYRLKEKTLEIYKETGVLFYDMADKNPVEWHNLGWYRVLINGKEYWSDSFSWALLMRQALDKTNFGIKVNLPGAVLYNTPSA